jgi:hypothetical protein
MFSQSKYYEIKYMGKIYSVLLWTTLQTCSRKYGTMYYYNIAIIFFYSAEVTEDG